MFFRFAAGLILVVLVSMVGIVLEKQTLEMKRAVSRQYFQVDLLLEMHAKLRLSIQELTAPSQLAEIQAKDHRISRNVTSLPRVPQPSPNKDGNEEPAAPPQLPLLRWEHPARATGL